MVQKPEYKSQVNLHINNYLQLWFFASFKKGLVSGRHPSIQVVSLDLIYHSTTRTERGYHEQIGCQLFLRPGLQYRVTQSTFWCHITGKDCQQLGTLHISFANRISVTCTLNFMQFTLLVLSKERKYCLLLQILLWIKMLHGSNQNLFLHLSTWTEDWLFTKWKNER